MVTGISLTFVASGAISAMAPTDLIHQSWQAALAGGLTWTLFLFGLVWIATRGVGAFHSERETARVRLESLMAAKDRFIATVSHEVRRPLTAVVGLSSQLCDAPELFTIEERDELLTLIAPQAREAAAIVEDLLVAARLDDGNVKVHVRPVDLGREVSTVLATVDGTPSVRYGSDPQPFALADPARVRQIVRNLITNAQRYGGPTITVTCGSGFVAVEDDGPGIPPKTASWYSRRMVSPLPIITTHRPPVWDWPCRDHSPVSWMATWATTASTDGASSVSTFPPPVLRLAPKRWAHRVTPHPSHARGDRAGETCRGQASSW